MRWALLLLTLGFLLLPHDASAAEAPPPESVADPGGDELPPPRGPIEEPEDWLAVAGIVCYSVLPILAIVTITVLTCRFIAQESRAALLPWERSDWLMRGAVARPPPPGLVLFRF